MLLGAVSRYQPVHRLQMGYYKDQTPSKMFEAQSPLTHGGISVLMTMPQGQRVPAVYSYLRSFCIKDVICA